MNTILIITDNDTDAKLLHDVLTQANEDAFNIEWVKHLSSGLERLRAGAVDAILVDLSLPDSQGIATLDKLFAVSSQIPIIPLCTTNNEMLTAEMMQRGVQAYLSKEHLDSNLVPQSLRNIILRKAAEALLYIEKRRTEITLSFISDAVIYTDVAGKVSFMNAAAEGLTGWSRNEAQGHHINEIMRLIDDETRQLVDNPVEWIVRRGKSLTLTDANTHLIRRDGRKAVVGVSAALVHDNAGRSIGSVIVFHGITAIQVMAAKMAYLAQHDTLTNLPNRMLLNDRITQAIAMAKRRGTHLALLFLDLDNFKHINDTLGHGVGDKLLQSIAKRLCDNVRGSDTVSRLGGDEFVIVVMQDKHAQDAALTAEKLLTALAAPHLIAGHTLHVTTSIGISIFPTDGEDAEALIKSADIAMYHAKEKGRNNYQFFKDEMNTRTAERLAIEGYLRDALERNEFILHYQPKVNLETGMITGAEALLRWLHPEWGLVMPERFVQIAEDSGLIIPIGRWVLREACMQAKRWEETGLRLDSIAVNISAVEFRLKDFANSVYTILNETGLNPQRLQLEITESILMRDVESSITILHQLKTIGVKLVIDDFGTGCSSVNYLHQFSIDTLKIAPAFVQEIGHDNGNNGVIVSAVIAMGASLKQHVTAEGVEKWEQLAFLKVQHCEEGQGYFFSRPIVAEQFAQLLITGLSDRNRVS